MAGCPLELPLFPLRVLGVAFDGTGVAGGGFDGGRIDNALSPTQGRAAGCGRLLGAGALEGGRESAAGSSLLSDVGGFLTGSANGGRTLSGTNSDGES